MPRLRGAVPESLRAAVRRRLRIDAYNRVLWRRENQFAGTDYEWEWSNGECAGTMGILADPMNEHRHFIQACLDLSVSYRVIDFCADDWQKNVSERPLVGCVAWPYAYDRVGRSVFEERMLILSDVMGMQVIPTRDEMWLYESKRRAREWLHAHNLPRSRTWVFCTEEESLSFLERCEYPVVFKTDLGASAHGVTLCRTRKGAVRLAKRCFGDGFRIPRYDPRDRQWGFVIFQEYIDVENEWRIIRVGDSFFCRLKGRNGEFFSGSGTIDWARPPIVLLDAVRIVTETMGFRSMCVDLFESVDRSFVINELHAVFGGRQLPPSPLAGRYLFDEPAGRWTFQHGDYFRNRCANLRVLDLFQRVTGDPIPWIPGDGPTPEEPVVYGEAELHSIDDVRTLTADG